jgi:hypothetical protein
MGESMPPDYFDDIKREFPSAELFTIPVRLEDMHLPELGRYMGRINDAEFEGMAPGTVWFFGPEGSSSKPLGRLVFVYRPEGWNTLFREETGQYEEVRHAETGEPLYQSTDFGPLAAMRVPEPEPWWTGEREVSGPLAEGLHLDAELDCYPHIGEPKTLVVVVRNMGAMPAQELSVRWVFENEVPQPFQFRSSTGHEMGGSYYLTPEDGFGGTLAPGRVAPFLLHPHFREAVFSHASSLSPEQYRLSVLCGEEEVHRVDGSVVGAYLDELAGE